MICSTCGKEMVDDMLFCPYCGNSISKEADDNKNQEPPACIKENQPDMQQNEISNHSSFSALLTFKIFVIVGEILCALGLFLPYIRVSFWGMEAEKSFKDLSSDYIILLIIAAIGVLFACCNKFQGSVLFGIVYAVVYFVDTNNYWEEIDGNQYVSALAIKGAGYYCIILGMIVLILFSIVALLNIRTDKR